MAQLTNQVAFTGSVVAVPTDLVYSAVQQNTAAVAVFDPQLDGSVIVRRAGTVAVSVSALGVLSGPLAGMEMLINGTTRASTAVTVSGSIGLTLRWKVAANDTLRFRAIPAQFTSVSPTGTDNTLSIEWTGVR